MRLFSLGSRPAGFGRSLTTFIGTIHLPAERVRRAILTACTIVAEQPYAGREHGNGVRVFFIPRFPYVIYYEADEVADTLTVLTIRHTAQRRLYDIRSGSFDVAAP